MIKRTEDEKLAAMLTALGQPNRLSVFRLLARQPNYHFKPKEVAERLNMTYVTAHYHLTRLSDAGLAEADTVRGQGYKMVPGVLTKLRAVSGRNLTAQDA